jgi:hypothetical protein
MSGIRKLCPLTRDREIDMPFSGQKLTMSEEYGNTMARTRRQSRELDFHNSGVDTPRLSSNTLE